MIYHGTTYVFDVIKTRIQIQSPGNEIYTGTLDCGRKIVAREGVAGLFRGFAPTVIRAFPASAAGFAVYEMALKLMPEHHESQDGHVVVQKE